jgi:glycosyltransferase involved in cell wall biosynthesis
VKDEERNLARALGSVPQGARLLAIDAESSDRSVAIARRHGCEVVVRPWAGFVETRRYALGKVQTPWTFMLDADEQLDAILSAALAELKPEPATDGYTVARATFFCGQMMRHGSWGEERLLRLFRTGRANLVAEPVAGGAAQLHERWTVPGRTGRLQGTLLHYSYPSLADYRAKFERYTSLEAQGLPASALGLGRAIGLAALRAPYAFFVKSGWRDGWRGAYVALASAWYPVVVAWKALRA